MEMVHNMSKKWICISLFLILPHTISASNISQSPETSEISYKDLVNLRNNGQLDQAKLQALRYLQMRPNDVDVRFLLASIYFSQSQYQAAYVQAKMGLDVSPKYSDLRVLLIRIYLALNNPQEALNQANIGLQYDPDNYLLKEYKSKLTAKSSDYSLEEPGSVAGRLTMLLRAGKIEDAKTEALKAQKSNPYDYDVALILAHIYFLEKNYGPALQLSQKVVQAVPNYSEARVVLARTLLVTNHKDAALQQVNIGLRYSPNNAALLTLKAQIMGSTGTQEEGLPIPSLLAASDLTAASGATATGSQPGQTISQSDYIPSIQGSSAQQKTNTPQGQGVSPQSASQVSQPATSPRKSIQEVEAKNVEPRSQVSQQTAQTGPGATKLTQAPTSTVKQPVVSYQKLMEMKKQGKTQQAKVAALQHLEQYPDDGDVEYFLAQVYFEERDYKSAQAYAEKALKRTPNYVDVRLLLIRLNLATGNKAYAMQLLDQGIKISPRNNELQSMKQTLVTAGKTPPRPSPAISETYQKLMAMKNAGKRKQAKEEAIKYLQTNPDDADIELFLAQVYLEEKNYVMAKSIASRALKAYPKYEDVRLVLINVALEEKKTQEAFRLIAEGFKYSPNSHELQKIKKLALGQYAEVQYKIIQDKIDTNQIQAAWYLAVAYLSKYPNDDDVRYQLAQIFEKEKNTCFAKNVYHELLAKNPLNMDARLALINILKDEDCKLALDLINEGFCYFPRDSRLVSRRAELYNIESLYFHSMAVAKEAVCLDPKNEHAIDLIKSIKQSSLQYNAGVNEIGFYVLPNFVNDLREWWHESSVYYVRHSRYGDLVLQANNAYRFGRWATQAEIDLNPVINQYVSFNLEYAYADNPFLFPHYRTGGEIFINIPNFVSVSAGGRHWHIADPWFNVWTASIGKETDKYWLLYRPYLFVPKEGERSTLHTFKARKYFDDPDTWLDITAGFGHSPDLNDLLTANFIVINNKFVVVSAQIPICKHTIDLGLFVDYQRQVYPTRLLREIMGAGFGIKWRF